MQGLQADTSSLPIRITCPADPVRLCELRDCVRQALERRGFSAEDLVKIEMAVDEACSNVAEHAYPAGQGTITLGMDLTAEALVIHVTDRGLGGRPEDFNVMASLEDYYRLDRPSFSGLGLLIMKRFMDELEIDSTPAAGTSVTMRKYRSEAA